MKKVISALAFVFLGAYAFGQVVLTSSNYYRPGSIVNDVYTVENDMTDSVNIANFVDEPLVFDNTLETLFSVYGLTDSIIYDGPASEGDFTEATCSYTDANNMRSYIKVTDEKAVCLGVSGPLAQFGLAGDMDLVFDEPMDIITFPAQLGSETNSTAHGKYLEHISALQSSFDNMEAGPMIYQMLSTEYDSIYIDISVVYSSIFGQEGTLRLLGDRMQQGDYQYLSEIREFLSISDLYLHRIGSNEFTEINNCTLTNPMLVYVFGSQTINIGDALGNLMGMGFPSSMQSNTIYFWTTNDNYPIVEMTTNTAVSGVKKLAVRYGNQTCVENNKISANIYPNPTTDILNIEIEDITNGTISIYSVNGSLVKEEKINGSHNSINVSTLHNGNYFFRISCADKEIIGNFAKN